MNPTEAHCAASAAAAGAGSGPEDPRVLQAVEEYLAALEAGQAPGRDEFLGRHAAIAAHLGDYLDGLELIHRAGSPAGAVSDGGAPADDLAGAEPLGDFLLVREIGRGGMGVVYEAVQRSLNRKVALKVLPFAAALDARQLQRFKNEAQAAAGLHHPHIVPVFGVGCERGVHYYAMQIIDGQTLAAMIADLRQRSGWPAHPEAQPTTPHDPQAPAADTAPQAAASTERAPRDRAYFRRVAELGIQAAEALDHAHALGIVHRDVKPANLMVDGRGTLWVTDFGLAYIQSDARLTMTGDLVGTLRYMSPEQALANRVVMDHRTDVYSLGATLYELLTLEPVFAGGDRQELLRQIALEEPKPLRRVNGAIPAELETIVLKAMERSPADRYATAMELADDLRRFLEDKPIRARRPTLRQKAAKWARRNRPTVIAATIAAFVITAVLAGAAGFGYQHEQDRLTREKDNFQTRQERLTADATRQLDEAENQFKEIDSKLADPIKVSQLLSNIDGWHEGLAKARAAWQHAKDLASSNQDVLTAEVAERLQQAEDHLQSEEADWKVAKELDDSRVGAAKLVNGVWNPGIGVKRFEATLQALGIDLHEDHQPEQAELIRGLRLRYILVAGLDYWAMFTNEKQKVPTYLNLARLADPDPWRDQVRELDGWLNPDILKKLVDEADLSRQSPQTIHLLASRLRGSKLDAVDFLRAGLIHHPHDFWLHLEIAEATENQVNRIGHYFAALSVRPESSPVHNNLAFCFLRLGNQSGALRHFRKSLECDPLHIVAHIGLAHTLLDLKDDDAAEKHLQIAADLADKNASGSFSIEHLGEIHRLLADAMYRKQDLDGAIAHYRKAVQLDPNNVPAHTSLGKALADNKDLDGAILHYEKAVALAPDSTEAHNDLGAALVLKGKLDEAVLEFREAIRLKKDNDVAYNNLGAALDRKGDLDGAIDEYREAIRLKPDDAIAHYNLGAALSNKGDLDGAIAEYREAIRSNKAYAAAHHNLGFSMRAKGDVDGAIAEFREAIRFKPDHAEAHHNLGNALSAKGDLDGAIAEYREAILLKTDDARVHINLGNALARKGDMDGAIAEFREAIRFEPELAEAHNNLGAARCAKGQLDEAIAELREAIRLKKDDARVHNNLGNALRMKGALDKLPGILKGEARPTDAADCIALAELCLQPFQRRYAASARFFGNAFATEPKLADDLSSGNRYNAACVAALAGCGAGEDAAKLPDAERTAFRKQALDRLRADLNAWRGLLDKEPDKARPTVAEQMQHWLSDPDFNSVRGPDALGKLPEAERKEWQKLWADVAVMLAKAQGRRGRTCSALLKRIRRP